MAARYLMLRGDTRIKDIQAYAANSKWRGEAQAVGLQNFATDSSLDAPSGGFDRVKQARDRLMMRC